MNRYLSCVLAVIVFLSLFSSQFCFQNGIAQTTATDVLPFTDAQNKGDWKLNTDISDEFETATVDQEKWLIQGTNGEYKSNWIGRAPSQFSTDNVRIEDGKLKLQTRWEPNFNFSDKPDKSGTKYENITTAAVISKANFLYGYMEIKCKAADASITSSFWMTGNKSELDIFEHLGNPSQKHKTHLPTELWSSIHDWSKPGGPSTWTDRLQLDFRVADDFHVYGAEWHPEYLKFYADGKLVRTVLKEEVGEEGWVIDGPLWVWVDSETFPWHGLPAKEDLPVDYEIEYIRIWQNGAKSTGIDPAVLAAVKDKQIKFDKTFHGFEAPIEVDGDSKNWWIDNRSAESFSISSEKAAKGKSALKLSRDGDVSEKITAFAPNGSLELKPGRYTFSMNVFVEPGSAIKNVKVIFDDPWLELKPIDLSKVATGQWVKVEQSFKRQSVSGAKDRIRIQVLPGELGAGTNTIFFDDLSVEKN